MCGEYIFVFLKSQTSAVVVAHSGERPEKGFKEKAQQGTDVAEELEAFEVPTI